MTTTPQAVALMAQYNQWANERAYDAATRLGEAEVAADKGAFFGSILGTLNHIAVGDTIWMQRFAQHLAATSARVDMSAFPRPTTLTEPLAADLAGLRTYRRRLDDVIVQWAGQLTQEHLAGNLTYTSTAGARSTRNFGALLMHLFNHQTHHRGQVSTLLFQSGVDVGVTDLLALIPSLEP